MIPEEQFEIYLRKICFQQPPAEAYDLAKSTWLEAHRLGREEGLEEAAKICEARYMGDNNREDQEATRCARAIREKIK